MYERPTLFAKTLTLHVAVKPLEEVAVIVAHPTPTAFTVLVFPEPEREIIPLGVKLNETVSVEGKVVAVSGKPLSPRYNAIVVRERVSDLAHTFKEHTAYSPVEVVAIMSALPALCAVISPVELTMVATDVLLEDQVYDTPEGFVVALI